MNSNTEKKNEYIKLAKLIRYLECFNKGIVLKDEYEDYIKNLTYLNMDNIKLPSGRIGNMLALALELNFYYTATFLIEHASEIGISTDIIAKKYKKVFNIKKELDYSKSTMHDELRLDDDFIRPALELNIASYKNIKKMTLIKERKIEKAQ